MAPPFNAQLPPPLPFNGLQSPFLPNNQPTPHAQWNTFGNGPPLPQRQRFQQDTMSSYNMTPMFNQQTAAFQNPNSSNPPVNDQATAGIQQQPQQPQPLQPQQLQLLQQPPPPITTAASKPPTTIDLRQAAIAEAVDAIQKGLLQKFGTTGTT
jgi:hypothetical protein